MENVTQNYINDYQGLIFIPDRNGLYKQFIESSPSVWITKDRTFEPGDKFMLLDHGLNFGSDPYIIAQLHVILDNGTMDERSGAVAISVNDITNSGKLYTREQLSQIKIDTGTILLQRILDEGIETYKNLLIFADYFETKIASVINVNQSYPDMYRDLWNNKEKIWNVLSRDLAIKAWQCLRNHRFAQTIFYFPRLYTSDVQFYVEQNSELLKTFKLFNIPYAPVLAESPEAYIGPVEAVTSFKFDGKDIPGIYDQLLPYKAYSQKALIASRELLTAANIEVDQVVEIINDSEIPDVPKIPDVPEIYNPDAPENQLLDEDGTTPDKPKETKKTNTAIPWAIGLWTLFKLFV